MSFPNDLQIAVICSSNVNRSMEAHAFLAKKGFNVNFFGTGRTVRLPGTSSRKPNSYEFGRSYKEIANDLIRQNEEFYTEIGVLSMLDRNHRIKECPQRFQDAKQTFDVLITCDEKVYDQVLEYMENRTCVDNSTVHLINIDIKDNAEDATLGAFIIYELVTLMSKCEDLDNELDELLSEVEIKTDRRLLHCVLFY